MNSLSLRTLRGQILRGASTLLLFASLMLPNAIAMAPEWWTTRSVLKSGTVADDYAVANIGQLKTMASKAMLELDEKLPYGAGEAIHALTNAWTAAPAGGVSRDDYAALTLGQLKTVGRLFYDRLAGMHIRLPNSHPWTGTNADDYSLANLGQLKKVFSFDTAFADTNANGIPDLWETAKFGDLTHSATEDADGDGLSNLAEWQARADPNISDSDGDGINDDQEVAEGTDPTSAASNSMALLGLRVLTPLEDAL